MTNLDPPIHAAIARSLASHGPPPNSEARMLADFHARLQGPPPPAGESAGPPPSPATGAQVVWGLKVAAAVLGLTAAGLGGVWSVAKLARGPDRPAVSDRASPRAIEASAPTQSQPLDSAPPMLRASSVDAKMPEPAPRPTPPRKRSTLASPKHDAATLGAELQLIRAARSAPATEALELLDRHAEQFPEGELGNEREGLRVIALCELGRSEEARRASEQFLARSPSALLIERVANKCREQVALPTTGSERAGNR